MAWLSAACTGPASSAAQTAIDRPRRPNARGRGMPFAVINDAPIRLFALETTTALGTSRPRQRLAPGPELGYVTGRNASCCHGVASFGPETPGDGGARVGRCRRLGKTTLF